MEEKLSDETTSKTIAVEPKQDIKLKLLLRNKIIDEDIYKVLYPHVTQIPGANRSQIIDKEGYSLREMVDSTNRADKKICKLLPRIIKTYTLDNLQKIKNSRDLMDTQNPFNNL